MRNCVTGTRLKYDSKSIIALVGRFALLQCVVKCLMCQAMEIVAVSSFSIIYGIG